MRQKTKDYIVLALLVIGLPMLVSAIISFTIMSLQPPTEPTIKEVVKYPTISINEWDLFTKALIQVESEGETDAVGTKKDLGVLQITPIYVEEVNRILKHEKYTHKDALDSLKSIQMFNVIQSHRNPTKCLKTSLLLHNPRAMSEHYMTTYEYRVMYWFYKLKCEELEKQIKTK